MAETIAIRTDGITLRREGRFVPGVMEVNLTGRENPAIPVTSVNSTAVENIVDIPDNGSVELVLSHAPMDPVHRAIREDFRSGVLRTWSLATTGAEKHAVKTKAADQDGNAVGVQEIITGTVNVTNASAGKPAQATITPRGVCGAGDYLKLPSESDLKYVVADVDYSGDEVIYKIYVVDNDGVVDKTADVPVITGGTEYQVVRPAFTETFTARVMSCTPSFPAAGKQELSVSLLVSGSINIVAAPDTDIDELLI